VREGIEEKRDSMLSGSYQSPNNENNSRSVSLSMKEISVTDGGDGDHSVGKEEVRQMMK